MFIPRAVKRKPTQQLAQSPAKRKMTPSAEKKVIVEDFRSEESKKISIATSEKGMYYVIIITKQDYVISKRRRGRGGTCIVI